MNQMGVSVKVTLGGVEYTIPKMNIGQLERVSELTTTKVGDDGKPRVVISSAYKMLEIAFERSDPRVIDFNSIEADHDEINEALPVILAMNRKPDKNKPGETQPPGAPPSPGGSIGTTSSDGSPPDAGTATT
jgi:hypothetical protein